jgi:hypothetical protein
MEYLDSIIDMPARDGTFTYVAPVQSKEAVKISEKESSTKPIR